MTIELTQPATPAQWWRAQEIHAEPHALIWSIVRSIRQDQAERYEAYKRWAEIYGSDLSAFGLGSPITRTQGDDARGLTTNQLANAIDTLHANVYRNKVVPIPSTVGGDWLQQQTGKRLGRWVDGAFDEARVHEDIVPMVGLDALTMGTGFYKVFSEDGNDAEDVTARICVERIPPWDVYIDRIEQRYGRPRSMHQQMLVDRYVLLDKFADDDPALCGTPSERMKAIETIHQESSDHPSFTPGKTGDMIVVTFSWHLPSGPRLNDGAYAITIRNCTLAMQPWKRKRFPLIPQRWGLAQGGYYGMSAVERAAAAQREHDKLSRRLQIAHDLIGIPKFLVGRGAAVSKQHIDDVIGTILEVADINQIREWAPVPIHPEVYQYRQMLAEELRGILGVSNYEAQGEIPAGLKNASGVALARYEDTSQSRLAFPHRSYETAMSDVAETMIDEAAELEEQGVSVQVRAREKGHIEPLKFSDVKMDRKSYVLRIPPQSALAKSPSMKLQQLLTMLQGDPPAISMRTFRRLSEVSDLEAENDLDTADEDIILRNLTQMTIDGEYLAPMGFDDLNLAMQLGGKFLNKCRVDGVPADRQALIAQWLDDVRALLNPEPPPPPVAPDMGAAPMPGDVPPPLPEAPPMPPGPGGPMSPGGVA